MKWRGAASAKGKAGAGFPAADFGVSMSEAPCMSGLGDRAGIRIFN